MEEFFKRMRDRRKAGDVMWFISQIDEIEANRRRNEYHKLVYAMELERDQFWRRLEPFRSLSFRDFFRRRLNMGYGYQKYLRAKELLVKYGPEQYIDLGLDILQFMDSHGDRAEEFQRIIEMWIRDHGRIPAMHTVRILYYRHFGFPPPGDRNEAVRMLEEELGLARAEIRRLRVKNQELRAELIQERASKKAAENRAQRCEAWKEKHMPHKKK